MSQGRQFRTDDSKSKVTKDCFYAYDPSSFALAQDCLIVQYGYSDSSHSCIHYQQEAGNKKGKERIYQMLSLS